MRIEEDDHPAIYNWSYIELGNVCGMHAAGYSHLLLCAFSCGSSVSTEDVLSWRLCLIACSLACSVALCRRRVEQEQYNPDFVEQVAAMEERAKKVGVEGASASSKH